MPMMYFLLYWPYTAFPVTLVLFAIFVFLYGNLFICFSLKTSEYLKLMLLTYFEMFANVHEQLFKTENIERHQ